MSKNLKTFFILLFVSSFSFTNAQTSSEKNNTTGDEKAFGEGKMTVTVGYGFPHIYKTIFKAAYTNSNNANIYSSNSSYAYDLKGIGPAFLKFEYGLNKVVAIGASIGYYNFTLTQTNNYQRSDPNNPSSNNYVNYTDTYKWYYSSLSAGVRINFHFATGKKLDPYAGIAGGYSLNRYVLTQTSTYPGNTLPPQTFSGYIPIYFSITAGLRYYFTENIGIYGEVGIDKWSVIQGGLAVKF